MLDLTVASMMTGLVSVSLGAPVDLVKIRLQMQTQPILARKSEIETRRPNVMLFLVLAISKLINGVLYLVNVVKVQS